MTDIGIELYEAISEDFDKSVESDTVINDIRKRMDNGTASSKDIALYANRLGLWIRTAIERNVSADKLPNGQMYYNIAEKILRPSLQTTNQMFNAVAAEIQKLLDSKQGIRIKPQTVSLPEERIDDVIGAASEPGISEEVMQRRMSVPAETIIRSYADDYARANADFRSRAGIDEYIVRRDDGSCCEWCSHLAGRYRYPDEVPKDVYRRHDNCGCIVEHQSGGMRKNVHTKRSGTDEQQREALRELDERKQQQREKIRQAAENAKKPRVLSKADGSRIEAEVLAKRRERLTGGGESSIIISKKGSSSFPPERRNKMLRDEAIISGNNFETAIIYNADGSLGFKKKGLSDKVIFTDKQISQMNGKVLTHNHPNGSNFSTHDINMMRKGNLQEIRACNSKGAYVLRRRDVWANELDSFETIEKVYNEIEDSLISKHLDLKAQNGLSLAQYLHDLDDEVMTELAKRYGLEYFWEERTI